MSQNVVYLHEPPPVGHYLRVGSSGHRQLEILHGSGKLGMDRVVFDASMVSKQRDLITALGESGAELILDTNVAELSSIGRFSGSVKAAPWANPNAVLSADDLAPTANRDLIGEIARFAVKEGFHTVQAPSHFLSGSTDPLLAVDIKSAEVLRLALDRQGGKHVGVDYSLMIPNAALRDPAQRRAFITALASAPFDNLWFRVSGFGSDASAVGLRRYIAAVIDFHRLGRPVVADGVGGLAGLATIAFGASSGICHGVAEKERFNAADWAKPPKGGGGGREKRVLVEGLDRLLSLKQMKVLMDVPSARRHFSCSDSTCCPRGLDDTLKDPKAHYLRQRQQQIAALARVPELRRSKHFLDQQLAPACQFAAQAAKLEVPDPELINMLTKNSERLEKSKSVLTDLSRTLSGGSRSAPAIRRRGVPGSQARRGDRP